MSIISISLIVSSEYWGENTGITNKMLLGVSLSSNKSSSVSCAHAWAHDVRAPLPVPVGKCYNFNGRGQALYSFEPLLFHPITRRIYEKTTKKSHISGERRPLHSHLMTGFSSAFINVINSFHVCSIF
jgi:hypothetical protein